MAKKCGLSVKIDTLVVEQVFRLFQYEQNQQDACSLNLSIEAITDEAFQIMLFTKLAHSPELCKRIIIEISEYYLSSQLSAT